MSKEIQKLRLNSITNAEKSLARLARDFHANPAADCARYRTVTYIIRTLLESYQNDRRADVEERLVVLEKRMDIDRPGAGAGELRRGGIG